jgi:hypothetical protein
MNPRLLRWASLFDVIALPLFILWFIWQLQFTSRWTWIVFPVWLTASFLFHRDTPKTMGWRADNLWPACWQALNIFLPLTLALIFTGFQLGAPHHMPAGMFSWRRFGAYFAFCLLQQVALNSLLQNRMLSLVKNHWAASSITGAIFAVIHWPNPVLVPATFVLGTLTAWLFSRHRNIIPLAVGQAVLGTLAGWAFPYAWIHHLRVGPGYYGR